MKRRRYIGIDATINGRLINFLLKLIFRNNNGCKVLNETWDHLIILDACRFDVFKEEIKNWNIEGKLEYRISRGANTPTFLIENFTYGKHDDIVYVSGNPYTSAIKDYIFKEIPVYINKWNHDLNTVLPWDVYYIALKAFRKYGKEKKLVIHFMQPHHPFLTMPFTCKLRGTNAWILLKQGKMSRADVLKGYRENLRVLRPYIEKLVRVLDGRIVITSDHGNGFGEKLHPIVPKRVYGHSYAWIRIEPLVKVPWFITEGKNDRKLLESELVKLSIKERLAK